METKKINVFYKNKENIIDINIKNFQTFESFLKKINEEFQRTQSYQLMAMNSSEPFVILTPENYLQILNEEIPEGLKLFMSEMVKASDSMPTHIQETQKEENKENEENNEEDDLVIEGESESNNNKDKSDSGNLNINHIQEEKEKDKEENSINNIIEEEKEKEENIINNIIEEEKENNNEENNYTGCKSVIIEGKTSGIPENNNIIQLQKDSDDNLDIKIKNILEPKETKIENDKDYIKNKCILTSSIIDKEMFNSEKCCICALNLKGVKYICCLCDNCTLCEECELNHNHPCFKYKTHFISSLNETSEFISKFYNYNIPHESTGYTKLFRKEYDIKISPYSDTEFTLRPNKTINIPIKILNYTKEKINSSQFIIICKNQKNIFFTSNPKDVQDISEGEDNILNIKCVTPNKTCKKENIFIEIYSTKLKIKSSRRLCYEYNIEVNFDSEDDKLNMELKNDDCIFCFNKTHKRKALELFKSTGNIYKIKDVFNCLFDNNWDTNKATKALKKKYKKVK